MHDGGRRHITGKVFMWEIDPAAIMSGVFKARFSGCVRSCVDFHDEMKGAILYECNFMHNTKILHQKAGFGAAYCSY
jgi:hypothetical protein